MSLQHKIITFQQRPRSLKRQQGVVIVVALFIVALTATLAYYMLARLERDISRTSLILHNAQAEGYAQGSIAWAMDQLRNNWETRKTNKLIDKMPLQSVLDDENGYKIQTTIYDMQARFNLNNLINVDTRLGFMRLLQTVLPTLPQEQVDAVLSALVDWITLGQQQNNYNQYYMAQPIPYRAAHQPLSTVGELQSVKNVTPTIIDALQPYVVALPAGALVNVQTASPMVLLTLSPAMNLEVADTIVKLRATQAIVNTADFFNLEVVKNHHIATSQLTTVSQYFLVETKVAIEKQQVVIYTLLSRTTDDRKATLHILWQSKGIW